MIVDTLTAVVTGAASGIGQALAEALHARGATLVLADIAGDPLTATAERLGATGVVADVSDPDAMRALAESVPDANLVCLNAGMLGASLGAPWEVPAEEWDRVFAVNVGGIVNGLRAFVPRLLAAGRPAHVLITASLAGLAVFPGGGAYGPSKHAVTAIAQHAAMALADTPVGVSMICPALVSTGMSPDGVPPALVADEALRVVDNGVFAVMPDDWRSAVVAQVDQIVTGQQPTPPVPGQT
jgi:NAD(P)-dependent dehydrogenase (short-subunit alcohol dehydrogenase family)